METYTIPPYENSFGRATVGGKVYYFSFNYNEEGFWTFGLWKNKKEIIYSAKLVRNIPLNCFFTSEDGPKGYFFCKSKGDVEITKEAVMAGAVALVYVER